MRLIIFALTAALVFAQAPKQGKVERIKVHGPSLEGNLEGDSPDREVSIYLPPSYANEPDRRYPVVYFTLDGVHPHEERRAAPDFRIDAGDAHRLVDAVIAVVAHDEVLRLGIGQVAGETRDCVPRLGERCWSSCRCAPLPSRYPVARRP